MDSTTQRIEDSMGGLKLHESGSGITNVPARSLYHREGLIRYILCCCQAESGGLRDKPGKHADAYHSCYALTGLSSAQHRSHFASESCLAKGPLECAFGWSPIKKPQVDNDLDIKQIHDAADIVEPVHPIFVIPYAAVEHTRSFFSSKTGF
ncbi:CAAX farnesyltransferase (FTase) subunit beta [Xylographa carneopallida]|nr:CAAX farnesyltransferase (FTase) subunit beta [Xylographa carneopallida]